MQQLSYYKLRQKFVTKCVRFFVTKCDSFITICNSYYKMCELCYNMQQLLQNAKFIKTCVGTFSHMLPVFCPVSAEVFIFSVSASGTAVVVFFIFRLMFFFQITHLTFVDWARMRNYAVSFNFKGIKAPNWIATSQEILFIFFQSSGKV